MAYEKKSDREARLAREAELEQHEAERIRDWPTRLMRNLARATIQGMRIDVKDTIPGTALQFVVTDLDPGGEEQRWSFALIQTSNALGYVDQMVMRMLENLLDELESTNKAQRARTALLESALAKLTPEERDVVQLTLKC